MRRNSVKEKVPSLSSPDFEGICGLAKSWQADVFIRPKVSTAMRWAQRVTDYQCWHSFPLWEKPQALLQHLPRWRTQ